MPFLNWLLYEICHGAIFIHIFYELIHNDMTHSISSIWYAWSTLLCIRITWSRQGGGSWWAWCTWINFCTQNKYFHRLFVDNQYIIDSAHKSNFNDWIIWPIFEVILLEMPFTDFIQELVMGLFWFTLNIICIYVCVCICICICVCMCIYVYIYTQLLVTI